MPARRVGLRAALHARAGGTLPADAGVARVRRSVVVKLGSSTLVDARGRPRRAPPRRARGRDRGAAARRARRSCVVSSGAIALGARPPRPAARARRRARAAGGVGRRAGPARQRAWQRAPRRQRARARAGAADRRRRARPRHLPERARHARDAAALGRRAGRQRERLDRHGRDHVRRQRRARRPGRRAAARPPARAADRPGRPLHARPAASPAPSSCARCATTGCCDELDVGAPPAQPPRLGRHALEGRRGRDGVGRRRGVGDRARRARPGVLAEARRRRATSGRASRPTRGAVSALQAVAPLRPAELGTADGRRRAPGARVEERARACSPVGVASGRGTLRRRRRRHDLRARRDALRQGPRGGRRLAIYAVPPASARPRPGWPRPCIATILSVHGDRDP